MTSARWVAAVLLGTVVVLVFAVRLLFFADVGGGPRGRASAEARERSAAVAAMGNGAREGGGVERDAVDLEPVSDEASGREEGDAGDEAPPETATGFRGRVVDLEGRPVAGALVAAARLLQDTESAPQRRVVPGTAAAFVRFEGRADDDGRFLLIGLLPTPAEQAWWWYRLRCEAGDAVAEREKLPLVAGRVADLGTIVLRPGGRLSGQVVDEAGLPMAGVRVSWGREPLAAATRTDVRGRFGLSPVLPGTGGVKAVAEGFVQRAVPQVSLGPGEDVEGIRLQLTPGRDVDVYVLDDSGTPLPGVRVRGTSFSNVSAIQPASAFAVTDAEGHAPLHGLLPGAVWVVAHTSSRWGYATIPADLNRTEIRIGRGTMASGVVRGKADGAPIGGAVVGVLDVEDEADGALDAGLCLAEESRHESDERGRFTLPLPDWLERFRVWAVADGYEPGFSAVFVPGAGDLASIAVELVRAAPVEILVVDPGGHPLEDAVVRLYSTVRGVGEDGSRRGIPTLLSRAACDRSGLARFTSLPPGTYRVRVEKEGLAPAEKDFALERGRPLRLRLSLSEGAALEVHVRDGTGAPAAGIRVVAVNPEGERRSAETGPDGVGRLVGLPAGRWRVFVVPAHVDESSLLGRGSEERPLQERFPILLAEGAFQRVVRVVSLERPGRVVGSLLLNGRPDAGLFLSLRQRPGSDGAAPPLGRGTSADAQGRFWVGGLPPGRWLAEPRLREGVVFPSVAVDVQAGLETRWAFDLGSAPVRGRVVGPDGGPVAGARVIPEVREETGSSAGWKHGSLVRFTNHDGMFAFERLPEGHVRLIASLKGFFTAAPLELDLVRERPVDDAVLRVVEGGWLRLEPRPFPDGVGVIVEVRDERGRQAGGSAWRRPQDGFIWIDLDRLRGKLHVELTLGFGDDGRKVAEWDVERPADGNLELAVDLGGR